MREHVYYAGIILKNNYEKLGPAGPSRAWRSWADGSERRG